ncbi:hypothetical protein PanWU01x14_240670 [Parasponia andersonii]|uniref:DUF8204 domain-containing protein n=1 Tax=Parasponia andersonii TaxID=3476 RepID=A0A2P5BGP7_PARAD|nr:hypothetical protein PanWU01x14_240670 [Parasponia andersonii]
MDVGNGDPQRETPNQNQNPNPNRSRAGGIGSTGKSCKGCLFYSSIQKSKSKNPTCVGLSTTLKQVPGYIVGETELEASKEGRSFTDFKYACVGYSVFLDKKSSSNDPQNKQAELPFCVGLEVLLDKRPAGQTANTQAPAHAHINEGDGQSKRCRLLLCCKRRG